MWPLSLRAVPESYGVDIRMRRPLLALGQPFADVDRNSLRICPEQVAEPKEVAVE